MKTQRRKTSELRCAVCGRTEATAIIRTKVIDWDVTYRCDGCAANFDWSDYSYDGIATYTRRRGSLTGIILGSEHEHDAA